MRHLILALALPIMGMSAAPDEHELFTTILGETVTDGHVDYERLCKDGRLDAYIERLSATDPDGIADEKAKLAFWINAYNAFTLKIICDNYPVDSINDLHFGGLIIGTVLNKTIWDKKFIVINEKKNVAKPH